MGKVHILDITKINNEVPLIAKAKLIKDPLVNLTNIKSTKPNKTYVTVSKLEAIFYFTKEYQQSDYVF